MCPLIFDIFSANRDLCVAYGIAQATCLPAGRKLCGYLVFYF